MKEFDATLEKLQQQTAANANADNIAQLEQLVCECVVKSFFFFFFFFK